jgi:HTH-type transcriptional regulator/antitoxin MqsA
MICPACGGAELISDERDLPFTYKEEVTIINHVQGDYCPSCNEVVLRMDEVQRVMELKGEFIRKLDAGQA